SVRFIQFGHTRRSGINKTYQTIQAPYIIHMLQTINLKKSYGTHQALKGLDLTVNRGEVFCLLGQNGAGKTTTINICLGFLKADSGEVRVHGETVAYNTASSRKHLAYIPEVVMLYPQLT